MVDQSTIDSNFEGTIQIRNRNIVTDSEGRKIAMARNMQLVILDRDGTVQMALSIVAPTPFFTPATVAKILARARVLVLNRPT